MKGNNIIRFNKEYIKRNTVFSANIEDELFLFEATKDMNISQFPFVTETTVAIISPMKSMTIILPGELVSEWPTEESDHDAFAIAMSGTFGDNMMLEPSMHISVSNNIRKKTTFTLDKETTASIYNYCEMLKKLSASPENPYRLQTAIHLTKAFFYSLGYFMNQIEDEQNRQTNGISERFLKLLESNFKHHRNLEFYADKMSMTSKYLSAKIKSETGKNAMEWIEEIVTTFAKQQLQTTGLTVQQIGEELNFPDQSVFGKYFKRIVGISPKAYRERTVHKSDTELQ